MAQGQPPPQGFATRAFTPIRNPVYVYPDDDSFKTGHPAGTNVLERPAARTRNGVDPRTTVQGDRPSRNWTPIVGFPGPSNYNVWGLRPA
jgi:hypothetical protein